MAIEPDGPSVADVFAQEMAAMGLDPNGPTAGGNPELDEKYNEMRNPLTYAALSISQKTSLLPKWARDLKVLGLGAAEAPEMFVFMRDSKVPATPGVFDTPQGFNATVEGTPAGEVTKAQTVARALNQPYLWDEEELDEAMKRMQDAGYDVTSFEAVEVVWKSLVDRAANTFAASKGEKKVTPWDVLDLVARENSTAGGEGELDPNRRVVTRAKNITEISEGEAWSALQSNLSQMLGRDPSDQEVRDFTHRMNTLAARNPAITKTIQQYKNGDVVSQTTKTVDPGLTEGDLTREVYDTAQADPEYGAYQAASTYFNATQQALGAIGDV